MKILIGLLFFSAILLQAQNITIHGRVIDSTTKLSLPGANLVLIRDNSIGTTTDKNGIFGFNGLRLKDIITVSYVGYFNFQYKVTGEGKNKIIIELKPKVIPAQTVLVEGSVGKEGVTPLAFSKINRKDIEENYTLQDIPEYLGALPSTTFYSENGNGLGYNYLSIRGFDQRRISVSINGIPQNDPEDHNVYWLDFPDLLASTDLIQVQRGAGSGVTGYPAIGGSINIITSSFSNEPKQVYSASIGSYNTRKYSVSYSSGLIDSKYSVYANLSKTLSSGYRQKSWIDFTAYHISAVRYDKDLTTQINLYGGPIADGLAYTGLPKFAIKNKDLRTANYSYWEANSNNYTYTLERRPTEIENFSQPHFEILNEYQLNNKVTINSALFLVIGNGFFDFDGSWADTSYLRLTHANGFSPVGNPVNTLIRAQVENTQYGWIPRVSIKHNNGELIIGGEFRLHRSTHWGGISFAENLPVGVTKDYRYYSYKGGKDIVNGFIHETYNINDKFNLLGEVQLAYNKYKLYDEKYIGTDFQVSNLFFNPRLGINYKVNHGQNIYLSFARVSREPRLSNYYNADEATGGVTPQFVQNPGGSYNFNEPLVKPETMNDIEFGSSINSRNLNISLNMFYMIFDNEIVKNGKVDIYGQPITGNVPQTLHRGVEFSVNLKLNEGISVFGNATYSKNEIKDGKYYINATDIIDLSSNRISGFPDFLANAGVTYKQDNYFVQITGKYVGKFYSDNYDENLNKYLNAFPGFVSYSDNVNDAYFNADMIASYQFNLFNSLTSSKVYFQINNIFGKLYSANAIGGEFFPSADRNFLAGLEIGL
jgi:iron complex outermembrane receptor protein